MSLRFKLLLSLLVLLAGCAVGPDYKPVALDLGERYYALETEQKEWVPVVALPKAGAGQWWQLFNEPELNQWIQRLHSQNLDLAQAEARYRQAQAALEQTRSTLFPQLGLSSSAQRSGAGHGNVSNQYNLAGNASWEIDIWGRIRRAVEASDAQLAASAADELALKLSIESTFVQSYFQAKWLLASQQLYDLTILAYERSLQMNEQRLAVGMISPADVASARAQLENARTQRLALNRQWGVLHNAMAVLMGVPPSQFELSTDAQFGVLPHVPIGIPAQLVSQRPDVAAAERRVAAANAQIGVAKSAWLPNLSLSAQGGFRSGSWSDWISAPARFWTLGPALALSVFDGGARQARVQEAIAAYDAQAAAYKKTALDALREVEDALVQWQGLQQEQQSQYRALLAARESLQLMRNQYEAGLVDYLSVVQVETSTLGAERSYLSIKYELFSSVTRLIAALGGRWDTVVEPERPVS